MNAGGAHAGRGNAVCTEEAAPSCGRSIGAPRRSCGPGSRPRRGNAYRRRASCCRFAGGVSCPQFIKMAMPVKRRERRCACVPEGFGARGRVLTGARTRARSAARCCESHKEPVLTGAGLSARGRCFPTHLDHRVHPNASLSLFVIK